MSYFSSKPLCSGKAQRERKSFVSIRLPVLRSCTLLFRAIKSNGEWPGISVDFSIGGNEWMARSIYNDWVTWGGGGEGLSIIRQIVFIWSVVHC